MDIEEFKTKDNFFHQHNYGISPNFWETEEALARELRIISVETAVDGNEFVNIYEGINYPIYGLQFHPEKATSAMSKFNPFPHSNSAIYHNRYFADFFVNEARKSTNKFTYSHEEVEALIGNH